MSPINFRELSLRATGIDERTDEYDSGEMVGSCISESVQREHLELRALVDR